MMAETPETFQTTIRPIPERRRMPTICRRRPIPWVVPSDLIPSINDDRASLNTTRPMVQSQRKSWDTGFMPGPRICKVVGHWLYARPTQTSSLQFSDELPDYGEIIVVLRSLLPLAPDVELVTHRTRDEIIGLEQELPLRIRGWVYAAYPYPRGR